MKKFKKLLGGLMAFVVCLVPLLSTAMPVQAAEPTTYYVKYVDNGTIAEWRMQYGTWNETYSTREIYVLETEIKEGDKVVIEGTGDKGLTLNINVQLSELTFASTSSTTPPIVNVKGVDNVYGILGSTFVVNGDVKNAYIYDACVCNLNNNVSYLEITNSVSDCVGATMYVGGTVDHAKCIGKTKTIFDLYSFEAGSFVTHTGALWTKGEQCSQTPPEAEVATPAPSTTTSTSTSSEYDDVPKTADIRFNPLWLVGLAAVCFAGSCALRKEK